MSLFQSFILGVVQGLTEFLPISSSAHLALLEQVFRIQAKLQITVWLHFGSVLALLVAMRKELKELFTTKLRSISLLIIGSIPAALAGLLLSKKVELTFSSPSIIGAALIITGIILWLTRCTWNYPLERSEASKHITPLSALIIGVAQAVALIPGISRSGITIATGIYLGVSRTEAAKFSFLLAIIAILGATIFTIPSLHSSTFNLQPSTLLTALFVSFLVSYFSIRVVLKVVQTKHFALFALYCWGLGFFIIYL